MTLALEPGFAADVGWQLSFAAVLGILLLATPLRGAIAARIGAGGWRRALADGAAMTIAATLATAPLIAFHFEAFSTTTLLANLLALPAVAPAMWLGMLAAAAGQVPGLPVEALNAIDAPLLAYIAQVAAWCGRPSWAYVHLRIGIPGLLASYLAIAVAALAALRLGRARRLAGAPPPRNRPPTGRKGQHGPTFRPDGGESPVRWGWRWSRSGSCGRFGCRRVGARRRSPPGGLRVSFLDVGQGDAILLQPAGAPAVLVDGGPPGEGLVAKLRAAGVERLGAAVVTHDQSDHAGGIRELLGSMPVGQLLYAVLGRATLAEARAVGAVTARLARGSELRAGRLRLDVLWPPRELLADSRRGEDPNRLAIVLLARWRRFAMLLAADAEAESTPLDPGPIDVLKVAHHGSEDAGLGELLDRARPRLAIVSVGEANPFGHPAPATLATLARHGVPVLRTDRDGAVVLEVGRAGARVTD